MAASMKNILNKLLDGRDPTRGFGENHFSVEKTWILIIYS
jgi:hypothetical protein